MKGAAVSYVKRAPAAIVAPLGVIAFPVLLASAVALSLAVQPPSVANSSQTETLLAWLRAGCLSAGVIVLIVGLVSVLRRDTKPSSAHVWSDVDGPEKASAPPRTAYTLVALGDSPDDARAIHDTVSAAVAVGTMRTWIDEHPDERVVVFSPDGEPMAFYRPRRAAHSVAQASRALRIRGVN